MTLTCQDKEQFDLIINSSIIKNYNASTSTGVIEVAGKEIVISIILEDEDSESNFTKEYFASQMPSTKELQEKVGLINFTTSLRLKSGISAKGIDNALKKLKKKGYTIQTIINTYLYKLDKAVIESRNTKSDRLKYTKIVCKWLSNDNLPGVEEDIQEYNDHLHEQTNKVAKAHISLNNKFI